MDLYMKMKLLIQLRAVHGELYIHILLRLIDICKKLLVTSLENGEEAYITDEISPYKLPASFRFYDSILIIVTEGISDDAKTTFHIKDTMQRYQR